MKKPPEGSSGREESRERGRQSRRARGEGTLHELPNGRWRGEIDLGWVNGRRVRRKVERKTKHEAARALSQLRKEREAGRDLAKQDPPLAVYLDHWLATSAKPTVKAKTYASYEQAVQLYLTPQLGMMRMTAIRGEHVQRAVNTLLERGGKDGAPLSPRTVTTVRQVLHRALEVAVEWGYIARNPVDQSRPPRVPKRQPMVLDADGARALLAAVSGHRLELLYRMALYLGMREGELLGLRWIDIDARKQQLRIVQTVEDIKGVVQIGTPKTDGSARTLPLPPTLLAQLEAHARNQAEERDLLADRWTEHGLVFPSEVGTPIGPRNLLRHYKALLVKAGFSVVKLVTTRGGEQREVVVAQPIRFHDLRHSSATLLIDEGVPLKIVSAILGHAGIQITADLYGHVLPASQREAIEKMEQLMNREKPNEPTT